MKKDNSNSAFNDLSESVLFRVTNLKASRDKRLQSWPANFSNRAIGRVGFADFDSSREVVMLSDNNGPLGVYRVDELEIVTPKQIELEKTVLALLSVFPNTAPEQQLNGSVITEVDKLVAALSIGDLRFQLRKHPVIKQRELLRKYEASEQKETEALRSLQAASVKADKIHRKLLKSLN
jgi:hypothetical protein